MSVVSHLLELGEEKDEACKKRAVVADDACWDGVKLPIHESNRIN